MNNSKIIIAGASQGFGHMKAASNISKEFTLRGSGNPQVIDIFDYFPFAIKILSSNGWEFLSTNFHDFYDYLYTNSFDSWWKKSASRLISKIVAKQLVEKYKSNPPDIFIATHTMAVPIGEILKKEFDCKFYVVATDFIVHSNHISPYMDAIYLPPKCEFMLDNIQKKIVQKRKYITGIPIDNSFAQIKDIAILKKQLLIEPNLKTALISFGGAGLKGSAHISLIKDLVDAKLPLQYIVLTGRNKKFTTVMRKLYKMDDKVKVFDYKENVSDFYAVADLFVGKAGGLSISEAAATNLPMFFVDKMPGQEEFNVKIMSRMHLGSYVPTTEKLISGIQSYLDDREIYHQSSFNKIARPKSSQMIMKSIVNKN